jgi:hypothetical protein
VAQQLIERQLRSVLLALAALQPECGYCQGMNFVTAWVLQLVRHGNQWESGNGEGDGGGGILARESDRVVQTLLVEGSKQANHDHQQGGASVKQVESVDADSAADAALCKGGGESEVGDVSAAVGLMSSLLDEQGPWKLRRLWAPGMPGLRLENYTLGRLVELFMPELHAHFDAVGLSVPTFASPWMATLFTSGDTPLPVGVVERMWMIFLAERSWKVVHRTALAMLKLLQPTLLWLDAGQILECLSGKNRRTSLQLHEEHCSAEELMQIGHSIKVTRSLLAELEHEFDEQQQIEWKIEQLRIQQAQAAHAARQAAQEAQQAAQRRSRGPTEGSARYESRSRTDLRSRSPMLR